MKLLILVSVVAVLGALNGCAEIGDSDQPAKVVRDNGPPPEVAAGMASEGRQLAEAWCASCHIISRENEDSGLDAAPAWPAIAQDPSKTDDYLRGFLTSPHGDMRDIPLARQEIGHLIAYIRSLAD